MLDLFIFILPVQAGSILLYWDRGTEPDIAGYIIWYGTAPDRLLNFIVVREQTAYNFQHLAPNKIHYFGLQAFDYAANLSKISRLVKAVMPAANTFNGGQNPRTFQMQSGAPLVFTDSLKQSYKFMRRRSSRPVLTDSSVVRINFPASQNYQLSIKTELLLPAGADWGKFEYQITAGGKIYQKVQIGNGEPVRLNFHSSIGRHLLKIKTRLELTDAHFALFTGQPMQTVKIEAVSPPPVEDVQTRPLISFLQNFANPFRENTDIFFNLTAAARVKLAIHNVLGQEVRVLKVGDALAGPHTFHWDGRDKFNRSVARGNYILYLHAWPVKGPPQTSVREIRVIQKF